MNNFGLALGIVSFTKLKVEAHEVAKNVDRVGLDLANQVLLSAAGKEVQVNEKYARFVGLLSQAVKDIADSQEISSEDLIEMAENDTKDI